MVIAHIEGDLELHYFADVSSKGIGLRPQKWRESRAPLAPAELNGMIEVELQRSQNTRKPKPWSRLTENRLRLASHHGHITR